MVFSIVQVQYLLGIVNLTTAAFILSTCRCLPGSRLFSFLSNSQWYMEKFYRLHCYFWWIFWSAVITHVAIGFLVLPGSPLSPVPVVQAQAILGILTLSGASLVFSTCRCLPQIIRNLRASAFYMRRIYPIHCKFWYVFWPALIGHYILFFSVYGRPF